MTDNRLARFPDDKIHLFFCRVGQICTRLELNNLNDTPDLGI